jgi:hypothetical protein
MPTAAIIKEANIVRTLLVCMAIFAPTTAVIHSAKADINSAAHDIYALKPLDVILAGFVQADFSKRPEGYRGFSGFVQEVRNAVRSTEGAPRTERAQDRSSAANSAESQATDPTYESTIPIKVGQNSRTGDTAEVYLGTSVRQILDEIPPTGTTSQQRSESSVGTNRQQGGILASASVGGVSLSSGGNWLSGGFLSTGNSDGDSSFGFSLRPLSYPSDLGNGPYFPRTAGTESPKDVIALRKLVVDMLFNPLVFFIILIICVFMFTARFRISTT